MNTPLSPHTMRVSGPVLRWQEAVPVGNGLLGALIFGHPHLNYQGGNWGGKAPFQIDANFCIPTAIMNMLMQVHGNQVHILPALPSHWKSGQICGLCLPHNVKADITWNGSSVSVTLHGEHAGLFTLSSPLELRVKVSK